MPLLFHDMLQGLQDPPRLHALLVHLPIAIAFLGLLSVLALVCTRGRSAVLRWSCVLLYVVGAALAFWAQDAGHDAAVHLRESRVKLSSDISALLHDHAEMGEKIWIFLAGTALVAGLTAIPQTTARISFLILLAAAALTTAAWVSVTGHYGGKLVYQYGVGAPHTVFNLPAENATPETPK